MALVDTTWYVNFGNGTSTGYYAVTVRPQNTAVAAGVLRRQFTAPAVGSERVFVCIVAGTTANVTDATWVLTRGAKTTDGTATWQECTGQAALNGDLTNTATWAEVKAATPAVLGQIIKRSSGASYQICTTAGAMSASEPTFSDTAGVTTTDTTAVWTSLGPVSNFTGGQAPFARLGSAVTTNWFASGNTIYVGHNHAETQNSIITNSASSALLARILCHNSSGSYPPSDVTTGATISTTGNADIRLQMTGSFYVYGITFTVAVGGSGTNGLLINSASAVGPGQNWHYYDNCVFKNASTHTNAFIQAGTSSGLVWGVIVFNNCTISFGHVGQILAPSFSQFTWQNTGQILAAGSSVPTEFISPLTSLSTVTLEALDLSQLTGSLFANGGLLAIGNYTVKDCKLNASATVSQPINTGQLLQFIRCDSAAISYTSTRYAYEGTETTETSITRVGGATDPAGQLQSRKIVTTANAQWLRPFQAEPYAVWNAITAANVTVTVYGTINSGTLPNNDDIWIEVEYLGSSATPLGTIVKTTKATLLASNAAVASDSSSWNGGGSGGGWSPFKLTTTLSSPQPGLAGYLHARIRAAKASATYYIDPQIILS